MALKRGEHLMLISKGRNNMSTFYRNKHNGSIYETRPVIRAGMCKRSTSFEFTAYKLVPNPYSKEVPDKEALENIYIRWSDDLAENFTQLGEDEIVALKLTSVWGDGNRPQIAIDNFLENDKLRGRVKELEGLLEEARETARLENVQELAALKKLAGDPAHALPEDAPAYAEPASLAIGYRMSQEPAPDPANDNLLEAEAGPSPVKTNKTKKAKDK